MKFDTITSISAKWQPLCADPRLRGALALLYDRIPEWRSWQAEVIDTNTKVVFEELAANIYGQYSPGTHTMSINRMLRDDLSSVVATILAHEIIHAKKKRSYENTRLGAGEWFADEIEAFAATAKAHNVLKTGQEKSAAARWHDTVAKYAAEPDGLNRLIMLSTAYQETIFGKVIAPHRQIPVPDAILVEEPAQIDVSLPSHVSAQSLWIGDDYGTSKPVTLEDEHRLRHTALIGLSGSGKSNAMLHWMTQDAKAGKGFCLIDPYGTLVPKVLSALPEERVKDVVFLDLSDIEYPFGLNLFDTRGMEGDDTLDFRVGQVTDTFKRVWNRDAMTMEIWARVIARTFMSSGKGTLLEAQLLLTDAEYRRPFLDPLTHIPSKNYWQSHISLRDGKVSGDNIQAFENRLMLIADDSRIQNIIGQEETTVDFDAWIRDNKIVILNLPVSVGEDPVRLVGTFLIQRFMAAAKRRRNPHPYYLYMDEFHYFATGDIVEIIGGMRNFGIGLILATQYLGRVSDLEVRESLHGVGNTVLFTLSDADAREFGKGLRLIVPMSERETKCFTPALQPLNYLLGDPSETILQFTWQQGSRFHGQQHFQDVIAPLLAAKGNEDRPNRYTWSRLGNYVRKVQDGNREAARAALNEVFMRERITGRWDQWLIDHEPALWEACKGLREHPVYTIPSNLKLPKVDEILPHLRGDYGDGVVVAKLLSVGETMIKTPFVPVTLNETRIARIREASRKAYCRRREEVGLEIQVRQQPPRSVSDAPKVTLQTPSVQRRVPLPPSS